MGNTYYQGIRLSNRIIISYSIGEGYLYTFLNGIRIYGFNGTDKKLIATKDLNCCIFSESSQRIEHIQEMLPIPQGAFTN